MMRYPVSWGAASPDFTFASLDVTAAFLNAPLPEGRVVILKPPSIFYKLQLMPPSHVWLVHKATYGLREAPNLWSEKTTESMTKVRLTSEGEHCSVLIPQIHKSLCLIVKTSSLLTNPLTDHLGLTNHVPPHEAVAMNGIYVDDYLAVGPPSVVESFIQTLRKKWKTSELQYLTCDHELTFLGVTLQLTTEGILLHHKLYTEDLLQEHSPHITARRRTTSGEPEHFKKDAPLLGRFNCPPFSGLQGPGPRKTQLVLVNVHSKAHFSLGPEPPCLRRP